MPGAGWAFRHVEQPDEGPTCTKQPPGKRNRRHGQVSQNTPKSVQLLIAVTAFIRHQEPLGGT